MYLIFDYKYVLHTTTRYLLTENFYFMKSILYANAIQKTRTFTTYLNLYTSSTYSYCYSGHEKLMIIRVDHLFHYSRFMEWFMSSHSIIWKITIVAWVDVNKVKEMKKWLPLTSLSYLDSIRNLEIFINDYRLFWDGHADCRANAIFRYMYMFIVYMSVKSYCTVGR